MYGDNGIIDFKNLWVTLEKKGKNKSYLRENGIHSNTIQKLVKNENVTCEVLARLCSLLGCDLSDICDFKKP